MQNGLESKPPGTELAENFILVPQDGKLTKMWRDALGQPIAVGARVRTPLKGDEHGSIYFTGYHGKISVMHDKSGKLKTWLPEELIRDDKQRSASSRRSHSTKKALRKPRGKRLARAAKKANDQLYDLVHNKYFQSIPVNQIFDIVKSAGFRFDPEEEEFILAGRDGKATWQLYGELPGRELDHMLVLQWHKMDVTGRYEVVAYVS